jgi:hypothetical protein
MTYTPVNMLLESAKYEDLASFLRSRDNREAIAAYVIDEGHQSTFFNNFPDLMYQEYQLTEAVGDVIKIRFMNMTMGNGVPGPAKVGHQLSGNEALSRTGWRSTQLTFGVHRYATAIENIVDKKILPQNQMSHILQSTTKWWTMQDDLDSFFTLFRDYPHYVSETESLTATEVSERVLPLFGRGYNDVTAKVDVIYAGDGTKADIEPGAAVTGFRSTAAGDKKGLADTDTLTDIFIDQLAQYISNSLMMPAIDVKGDRPFYGLVMEQQDMIYLFKNSSTGVVKTLGDISGYHMVDQSITDQHPIFTRMLGELYGIRFVKYAQIDKKPDPKLQAPHTFTDFDNTTYENLMGLAIKPEAKVLAAATTGDTVTGLTTWSGGYLKSGLTRGVAAGAGIYQLFVSSGARFFPYFDGTSSYGADSVNHIDVGLHGGGAATGAYYGRMQIGQGNTATTRWKIVYKGPVYAGALQVGTNNDVNAYTEDAYKLEIVGLYRWNPGAGNFDAASTLAADWAAFKAFLGVGAGNVIDNSLLDRKYVFNRRCHMFDVVRTVVYGKKLIYKVNGGGAEFNQELRDYGAFTGNGLNVVQGKKLVQSGQGLLNNHAVVCFKRPPVLLAS